MDEPVHVMRRSDFIMSHDADRLAPQQGHRKITAPSHMPASLDDAIEILKNEPDYDHLLSVLTFLLRSGTGEGRFNIAAPGPQASRVVQILVTEIVPNYWDMLRESSTEDGKSDLHLLLGAIRSLAGLNAILLCLRAFIQEKKSGTTQVKRVDIDLNVGITLELLCQVLAGSDRLFQVWKSTSASADSMRRRILSREFVNLVGMGRILSLSAEAAALVPLERKGEVIWTANGMDYAKWLADNVISWSKEADTQDEKQMAASLLSKAMHLGYSNSVISPLLQDLINQPQDDQHIRLLFDSLAQSEQQSVLHSILKAIADRFLNKVRADDLSRESALISAAAGVLDRLVANDSKSLAPLVAWLTNSTTGAGLGDASGIRRAVMALLASNVDIVVMVFDKMLHLFGDYLYIRHSPLLQQEVHTEVLLLSAGYVKRLAPSRLASLVRSGAFMNMVSKRLEAPPTRARCLGMIVGEALSKLAHTGDMKLTFNMEETNSEEALWYKRLVDISDVVGPVEPLTSDQMFGKVPCQISVERPQKPKQIPAKSPELTKAKCIIEEIDSTEEEDDDIVPLKKPFEDDEDSDDDPETVRRDRPKAPVYIRNLIVYLRATEDYDRQRLALTTAPTLIRRKASFGTEVSEHAEELASLLVGIQDKFGMENFHEVKIQAMIAIVAAQPQLMGPWFAQTFFNGDYSLAQRASVLTALGLGARELAGLAKSDYTSSAAFPSHMLPESMEKLYMEGANSANQLLSPSSLKALPSNALDWISKSLTSDFIAPLAANAADLATGPDMLKLSTFKSHLEQHPPASGHRSRNKTGVRAIPNTTAHLLSRSFFFPLTGRFQSATRSTIGCSRGIIFQPSLLSLYIKTLAILLHAAGPSTLALPDMTSELWDLLLGSSIRSHAVGDLGITHAVLFALLTLLEVNDNRMRDICQSMSKEVVETHDWVVQILHGTRGEDGGEENNVKMLAAGVLLRIQEGMERYRTLLLGDMI